MSIEFMFNLILEDNFKYVFYNYVSSLRIKSIMVEFLVTL
jgi:hypothetical protein